MSEIAIRVENVSKQYQIGRRQKFSNTLRSELGDGLKQLFSRRRSTPEDTIWALQEVSFDVRRGEIVGIIGRNGAGKSTLLKILSRITLPSSGRVALRGRVGSLLEVGTGFHPELTGRENIYLNGAILGMERAEIARKFDEIVAFAEVEKFIDTPVKRYSSGMYVRLAFAVAAHLEPEILLVDEVLAVGDFAFQSKCLGKMSAVAELGRTILFVSHNLAAIGQLCQRCIWLDQGSAVADDAPEQTIQRYIKSQSLSGSEPKIERPAPRSEKVQVLSVKVLDRESNPCRTFLMGQDLLIETVGRSRDPKLKFGFCIQIATLTGTPVLYYFDHRKLFHSAADGRFQINVLARDLLLMPGPYFVNVWLGQVGIEQFDYAKYVASFDVVQSARVPVTHQVGHQQGLVFAEFSAWQVNGD